MSARYDAARRDAWRAFLRAHSTVLEVLADELEERVDLPLSWYDVLAQLADAPARRLRMQALADQLVLSRSGLTRRVDRMEAAGLVERVPCEDDRRGMWAVATDRGLARLAEARDIHIDGVVRHFTSKLDADEARTLAVVLERVASSARAGRRR